MIQQVVTFKQKTGNVFRIMFNLELSDLWPGEQILFQPECNIHGNRSIVLLHTILMVDNKHFAMCIQWYSVKNSTRLKFTPNRKHLKQERRRYYNTYCHRHFQSGWRHRWRPLLLSSSLPVSLAQLVRERLVLMKEENIFYRRTS